MQSNKTTNRFSISMTAGGQPDEFARIWRLCRYSNDIACAAYGLEFLRVVENSPEDLIELDLKYIEVDGRYIPVLHSGYNNYNFLSSQKLRLTNAFRSGIVFDAMLIVPEPRRIIERPDAETGLGSALSSYHGQERRAMIDPLAALTVRQNRLDELRAFDSHPGSGTYCQIIRQIIDQLRLPQPNYELEFEFTPFTCDLATRFAHHSIETLMVSNQYMVQDLSKISRHNTGIHRLFKNEKAPIKSSVLLLGDSHSNSAIAPHLSHIFEQVRFIWASRRDAYEPFSAEILGYGKEADYIVEEIAERFFLNNFCLPIE